MLRRGSLDGQLGLAHLDLNVEVPVKVTEAWQVSAALASGSSCMSTAFFLRRHQRAEIPGQHRAFVEGLRLHAGDLHAGRNSIAYNDVVHGGSVDVLGNDLIDRILIQTRSRRANPFQTNSRLLAICRIFHGWCPPHDFDNALQLPWRQFG